MSATKTQLTGGSFQDSEGDLLANGYLTMVLNQDANVADSQICAGIEIQIQLDSAANVASSSSSPTASDQYVWANDTLSPVNTYYTVTGYTAEGQTAWGPNNQQVTSGGAGGGSFDTGTWVPNQIVWIPSIQPLDIEVAGAAFSSQTLLDFVNTGNVTFTDEGNGELSATAAAGVTSGQNVADILFNNFSRGTEQGQYADTNVGYNATTLIYGVAANEIACFPAHWKISLWVLTAGTTFANFQVVRTLPNSLVVVDYTPVTFGSTANPTFASTGVQTSDSISLQIDAEHDYYFLTYGPNVSSPIYIRAMNTLNNAGILGNFIGGGAIGGGGGTSPYFNNYTYPAGAGGWATSNNVALANISEDNVGLWLVNWQAA